MHVVITPKGHSTIDATQRGKVHHVSTPQSNISPAAGLFADPRFKPNAYPIYAHLRANDPISSMPLQDGSSMWFVARYDDAVAVLRDHARFSNDPTTIFPPEMLEARYASLLGHLTPEQVATVVEVDQSISRNLLGVDPPDHIRLRSLVSKGFTPRYVEALRPRIQQITDERIAEMRRQADANGGVVDLLTTFAFPLPLQVIAEMLGIPMEMRDEFRDWSNAAVEFNPMTPGDIDLNARLLAFVRYVRTLIAEKRETPGDDLVSLLVQAEEAGDRLTEQELIGMIFILIVAGHETTVNLIGNGLLALLDHPDQLALFCAQPELAKNAIEELLRYAGPVEASLPRWVREDTEFAGVHFRKGDQVMPILASADRDTALLSEPDRLNITREPTRHLAFGQGIHVCLGMPLARLEGQIALTSLLAAYPRISLAIPRDEIPYRVGFLLRATGEIPVRLG